MAKKPTIYNPFISGFIEIVFDDGRSEITPFKKVHKEIICNNLTSTIGLIIAKNKKFTASIVTDGKGIKRIVKQHNTSIKKQKLANELWKVEDFIK